MGTFLRHGLFSYAVGWACWTLSPASISWAEDMLNQARFWPPSLAGSSIAPLTFKDEKFRVPFAPRAARDTRLSNTTHTGCPLVVFARFLCCLANPHPRLFYYQFRHHLARIIITVCDIPRLAFCNLRRAHRVPLLVEEMFLCWFVLLGDRLRWDPFAAAYRAYWFIPAAAAGLGARWPIRLLGADHRSAHQAGRLRARQIWSRRARTARAALRPPGLARTKHQLALLPGRSTRVFCWPAALLSGHIWCWTTKLVPAGVVLPARRARQVHDHLLLPQR